MGKSFEIKEPWIQGKIRCQNGHVYIDHGYWNAEKGRADHKRVYIGKYNESDKSFTPNKTFYRLRAEYMANNTSDELYPDPSPLPQKSLLGDTYVDYLNRRPGNKKDVDDPYIPTNEYLSTKTSVSFICYHFVFCTLGCTKIFNVDRLNNRFKNIVNDLCSKKGAKLLLCNCDSEYVHMVISAPPTFSIPNIVKQIKETTSESLTSEFNFLSSLRKLWNDNYFVSTAINISHETIKWYLAEQRISSRQ